MKRKFLLLMLILSISFTLNVNAASNPYSSKGPYGINCTWYTWKKTYDKTGVQLPAWGNAKIWYNSAKKAGYSVGSEPKKKIHCCLEYDILWSCCFCRTCKWR